MAGLDGKPELGIQYPSGCVDVSVWVDARGHPDEHILDLACLPGDEFGRPEAELSMRIACVDFNGAEAIAAASHTSKIDEAFLGNHCTRVMKAIDLLCEFVTKK